MPFATYFSLPPPPTAVLSPCSDSRNAADTVGVNGIYVPVECILIIRVGVFEAAIQYACVREIFTLPAHSVCVRVCLSPLLPLSLVWFCYAPHTYFRLFSPPPPPSHARMCNQLINIERQQILLSQYALTHLSENWREGRRRRGGGRHYHPRSDQLSKKSLSRSSARKRRSGIGFGEHSIS